MQRSFRLTVLGAALLAASVASTPSTAAPLSMPAAAFSGIDVATAHVAPVATRNKPARRTAKTSKSASGGVQVAPNDVNGDGVPDTVTSKPTRKKPTGTTTRGKPTGGVNVQ